MRIHLSMMYKKLFNYLKSSLTQNTRLFKRDDNVLTIEYSTNPTLITQFLTSLEALRDVGTIKNH